MGAITTYVLDTMTGKPAAGIAVVLERKTHTAGWQALAERITNVDGWVTDFMQPGDVFLAGHYRLIFETGSYFLVHNTEGFFPQIAISFTVKEPAQQYHVPLLLSPFGYSTYRGR